MAGSRSRTVCARGPTRPEPSVGLARSDGLRLLYGGKEHTVIGEMESGKSWLAAACAAAEIVGGNRVLYVHFEECDPADTVERLLALGVSAGHLLELFTFVGPDEPGNAHWLANLLDPAPTLVILDGVNEAMSLHRWGIREEDGAAAFRRHLVKPCTAVGAATLSADHVVKDREQRGRGPLGSIHKGNGLTGSLLLVENAEPFGRGRRGRSHVFLTKDRPGCLRRHGREDRAVPGRTFVGELVVDDSRTEVPMLDLRLWKPNDDTPPESERSIEQQRDDHVLAVVAELEDQGVRATSRTVRARTTCSSEATADALTRLVLDGKLTESTGSRNAKVFSVAEGPGDRFCGSAPKGAGTTNQSPATGSDRSGTTQNQSEPEPSNDEEGHADG